MNSLQSLKLWTICILVSFGSGFPFFCTLYIPNTAMNSMQRFLNASLFYEQPAEARMLDRKEVTNGTFKQTPDSPPAGAHITLSVLWSLFIAEMALGQCVGYCISSPLIDRLGRRNSLILLSILQIPAQLCFVLAQPLDAWPLLYVGRFFSMLLFAVGAVVVPVFLNEVAPDAHRGSMGIVFPLSLSLGALMGGVLGMEEVLGSYGRWPFAFFFPMACGVLIVPLLVLLPETPQFLAAHMKFQSSRSSLMFYHGSQKEMRRVLEDARQEMPNDTAQGADGGVECEHGGEARRFSAQISQMEKPKHSIKVGLFDRGMFLLARKRSLRTPFWLTIAISISFCFSGIPIVSAYSTAILDKAGLAWKTAEYCTVALKILSVINYIMCLFLVDRVGRRPLLLTSLCGCSICWTLLMFCAYIPNVLTETIITTVVLFGAQFFMNIGIRPLFYVLVPELFPYKFRTAGKAFAAMLGTFILMPLLFSFWPLLQLLNNWVYGILAAPLWVSFFYIFHSCPETKGRSSAEIFQQLKNEHSIRTHVVLYRDQRDHRDQTFEEEIPEILIEESDLAKPDLKVMNVKFSVSHDGSSCFGE